MAVLDNGLIKHQRSAKPLRNHLVSRSCPAGDCERLEHARQDRCEPDLEAVAFARGAALPGPNVVVATAAEPARLAPEAAEVSEAAAPTVRNVLLVGALLGAPLRGGLVVGFLGSGLGALLLAITLLVAPLGGLGARFSFAGALLGTLFLRCLLLFLLLILGSTLLRLGCLVVTLLRLGMLLLLGLLPH